MSGMVIFITTTSMSIYANTLSTNMCISAITLSTVVTFEESSCLARSPRILGWEGGTEKGRRVKLG